MIYNEIKIHELIKLLDNYYSDVDNKNIANVEYPNKIKYKSNLWLNYIFYSCLLDYGMKSKIYHQNLINTYLNYPNIFIPSYVIQKFEFDKKELLEIMKTYLHPRYPNVAVDKWIKLSKKLVEHNNLLEQIKEFKNVSELEKFIKEFHCYGQKTGGLLTRLIYESGINEFKQNLSSIPLDRHDIEISYLNGIINKDKLNAKEIEKLSNLYVKYSNKLNIGADKVDKYLWQVGTTFCNKKDCINCPLYKTCETKFK